MNNESLASLAKIMALVQIEFLRAKTHYPGFHNSQEEYALLKEAVDAVWDAAKDSDVDRACDAAIQAAGLAIRFIFDFAESEWLRSRTNK